MRDPLIYEGQDTVTAAVVSGKADAMLADSPVVAYAVEQSKGKLEPLGDIYDSAPYGYVLPKDGKAMGEADRGRAEVAEERWRLREGAQGLGRRGRRHRRLRREPEAV